MGTRLENLAHIERQSVFSIETLCIYTSPMQLSNLSSVRVENCFRYLLKYTTILWKFNIMPIGKTDLGLNLFGPFL